MFIENVGCQPCDICTHVLIDDMAWLEANMSGLMGELANVSVGVYAYARLRRDQERIDNLRVGYNIQAINYLFCLLICFIIIILPL